MSVFAIIPSGGKGLRAGGPLPKQYLKFNGRELLSYTLEAFQKSELIDKIIIAADENYFSLIEQIKRRDNFSKIDKIVRGGKTRQESVYNGLAAAEAEPEDLIVAHDAVRPLLSDKILGNVISDAYKFDSAVAAVRAGDSLLIGDKEVIEYVDREKFFYVQTPQVFRYKIILDAMNKAIEDDFIGTDESMLVKRASYPVHISEGSSMNIKITTPEDIQLFKIICDNY